MPKHFFRRRTAALAGMVTLVVCLLLAAIMPPAWRETVREIAFDIVLEIETHLRSARPTSGPPVTVVDIDRRSIEAIGPWPWSRDAMAQLLERIAAAKPAATAIDVLFLEPDGQSPAALARRLGTATGRTDLVSLADDLPDGDKHLAAVMETIPTVLGFALDPDQPENVDTVPIMTRGTLPLYELWRAAGADGPVAVLAEAAHGLGTLSLPGDSDGLVRRVPLLVATGGALRPGLALETVRLAQAAGSYLVESEPPLLHIGALALPLPPDAFLRLVPVAAHVRSRRTLAAVDVSQGRADVSRLAGAIVLIGGSAPELGGLRQTPNDPLTPSVQIQADAVTQMLSGRVPRAVAIQAFEPLFLAVIGVLAVIAGASLPPLAGVLLALSALLAAWGAAVGLSLFADRLIDPLMPSSVATLAFVAASVTAYAGTRRREAFVRRKFEQHLAPAVVRRIVEQPELMKLGGERREVTAMFTDIESFTSMTHRAGPEELVSVLDEYFEGASAIVIRHGGMITKFVGDAVHALFNAPIDLDDHPRHAVACAIALRDWSETYRHQGRAAAIGLGRTRIGIETGYAVVGDVGLQAKLDYTAHGDAINMAARLEAANKTLASAICVGPAAAARCDPALLRPLGSITVRGRDDETVAVFEPWPEAAPPAWRERYLAAMRLAETAPADSAELFAVLAAERPDDPVPRRMAERMRAGA